MGIFDWLLGRKKNTDERSASLYLMPSLGKFGVHVVGESHYTNSFREICGPPTPPKTMTVTASLVPDPRNPHDANAIAIVVNGKRIGHLATEDAQRYLGLVQRLNEQGSTVCCHAEIKSGWEGSENYASQYSARLDLPPPPEEAYAKYSKKVRTLKSSEARRKAVEEGLVEIIDVSLRDQLRVEAARAEVDHVLAKVVSLKSDGAKRKQLEEAAGLLESWEVQGDVRTECMQRIYAALAQLKT